MDILAFYIISYIIQIGLGVYGYLKMSVRTVLEGRLRGMVLTFAVLPFMYVSIIFQVGAIAVYRYRGVREDAASSRLKSSFGSDDDGVERTQVRRAENPFDTGDDGRPPSSAAGNNPRDPGDGSTTPPQTPPSDNPFG